MRISIFGLGYVGCVSAGCLTKDGHTVIGVDVVPSKVDRIDRGLATVVEAGIDELLAEAQQAGKLFATTDVKSAVHGTDVSIVCVGTPSRADGSLDMIAVEKTVENIGNALKTKEDHHVVIMRSTVPPGTVDTMVKNTLLELSGKTEDEITLILVPEFLREGTAVKDYFDPPMVVVGCDDTCNAKAEDVISELFGGMADKTYWLKLREAELLKSVCNVFHALKVTFGNEIGALCQSLGIDGRRVMGTMVKDTVLNISPAYLRPGMPFGGSCLPKDLRSTVAVARSQAVNVPLLESILASNDAQKLRGLEAIKPNGYRQIGLDGLAFKSGTDDLRESPMVEIAEYLIGKGYDLKILDGAVRTSQLTGANKIVMEKHVPHLASRIIHSSEDLLSHADLLILTRDDNSLFEEAMSMESPPTIIDLTGAGREHVAPALAEAAA